MARDRAESTKAPVELTERLAAHQMPSTAMENRPSFRANSVAEVTRGQSFRANSITGRTSVTGRTRTSTKGSDQFAWTESYQGTDIRKCDLPEEQVVRVDGQIEEGKDPLFRDVLIEKLESRISSQKMAKYQTETLQGVLPLRVMLILSGFVGLIKHKNILLSLPIPIFYVILQLVRFVGYLWTEVVPDNYVTHYRGFIDLVFTIYLYVSFPSVLRVLAKMRSGSVFTAKADKGIGTLAQVLCWTIFFPLQVIPPIYNVIYYRNLDYMIGLESVHFFIAFVRSFFLSAILVTIFLTMRLLRLELKSVRAGVTEGKDEMAVFSRDSMIYFGNLVEVYCRVQQRVTMVSNALQSTLAFLLIFAVNSYLEMLMRFSLSDDTSIAINSPSGIITLCRNISYILLAASIHGNAAHLTALSDKTLNVLTHQYGCMMNAIVQEPDNELTNSGVLIVQMLNSLAQKGGFKVLSYRIDFQSFGLILTLILTLFNTLSSNIKF